MYTYRRTGTFGLLGTETLFPEKSGMPNKNAQKIDNKASNETSPNKLASGKIFSVFVGRVARIAQYSTFHAVTRYFSLTRENQCALFCRRSKTVIFTKAWMRNTQE